MAVYFVQHGKSLSKEIDPERSLSDEGSGEAKKIAVLAKNYGVQISGIVHSGKKRAEQTAQIFAEELKPPKGIMSSTGMDPLDNVNLFYDRINNEDNVMYVGHLPFMERITSYLVIGSAEKHVIKFQHGGIVCLDQDQESGDWYIKWTLFPDIQ